MTTAELTTVLIADHHDAQRAFLFDNLSADGYAVVAVTARGEAIAQLLDREIDLVLADVDEDTLHLLDTIRDETELEGLTPCDVPVIALTRRPEELHRVRLFDRGSDDVIMSPASYPELRARIAAVLRRAAPRKPPQRLVAGEIEIDVGRRHVTVAGHAVMLSATEYQLLLTLAADPTRVFTRDELMTSVWGYASSRTRTLDSHAHRLRRRLGHVGHPVVVNAWGVGYALIPRR